MARTWARAHAAHRWRRRPARSISHIQSRGDVPLAPSAVTPHRLHTTTSEPGTSPTGATLGARSPAPSLGSWTSDDRAA